MGLSQRYRKLFGDRRFAISFAAGVAAVILAFVFSGLAQSYAGRSAGSAVGDIFLDNIPDFPWPVLMHGILLWVNLAFIATVLAILVYKPEYWPAGLMSGAGMYIVRAFFISLTHLKTYGGQIDVAGAYHFTSQLANAIYKNEAFFFSSHTALPFIMALLFWKHRTIRYYLLGATVFFGSAVLLGKAHYSIDVFAAPLMSYSIFAGVKKIFPRYFERIDG